MKPIVCVGACAWTTIFRVPHLPQGSAKIIRDEATQIGDGMNASAACAVVKLGGRAEFFSRAWATMPMVAQPLRPSRNRDSIAIAHTSNTYRALRARSAGW